MPRGGEQLEFPGKFRVGPINLHCLARMLWYHSRTARMTQPLPTSATIVRNAEDALRSRLSAPIALFDEPAEIPQRLRQAALLTLGALLFILPVCFGGVHPLTYQVSETLVFLFTGAFLIFGKPAVFDAFSTDRERSTSRLALFCLAAVCVYALIQTLVFALIPVAHPVTGSSSLLVNAQATVPALRQLLFFLCCFVLARALFSTSNTMAHRFTNLCLAAGVAVSAIALIHWFSDNGMLFWTFAPEYRTISERARWPFVNPNHLGHFLLPVFFLLLARVAEQINALQQLRESKGAARENVFSLFLVSRTFQRKVMRISFLLTGALTLGIAIIGTQSRGSWLGLSVGMLVLLAGFLIAPKPSWASAARASSRSGEHHHRPQGDVIVESRTHYRAYGREKRLGQLSSVLSYLVKPAIAFLAIAIFFFFLNARGSELLGERINYGLMYSKDDTRWQLYADTLAIFYQHPLFGVGLGAWASIYPQYMNQLLSGITPVYLHSDPYQLLVELGVMGVLPLLLLAGVVIGRAFARVRLCSPEDGIRVLGLLCGLVAFLIASFLDFPFRIPAVSFLCAIYFALTAFYIDRATSRSV